MLGIPSVLLWGRFRHFYLIVNGVFYHTSSADPWPLTQILPPAGSVLPGTHAFGKVVNARVDLVLF